MKRHPFLYILAAIFITGILLLSSIHAGAASSRGLAVPKSALPTELGPLDIKDYYAAVGARSIGTIKSVVGHTVVFREDRRYAYYAASGDRVFERDVVYTLKGSRCRVQLNTSDVATMGENTRLMIKTYLDNRQTKVKSTTFGVTKGKAMFYALRLMKYKGSSMEVETPTAICGVRGTKWGMEVLELSGKPVASLPVQVADLSDAGFRHLAQANQPQFQTNVYSFEGSIRVASTITGLTTTLSGGQGLNAGGTGLGDPFTTPPGVASQFQADTSAPGGGGSGISGGSTGAGSGSNFPETSGSGVGTGSGTGDNSTLAQQQNINFQGAGSSTSTGHSGFSTTMLIYNPGIGWSYNAHLMTIFQDFSSPMIVGTNLFGGDPPALLYANGSSSYLDPIITTVYDNTGNLLSFTPAAVSHTVLPGGTAYTEWGYWTLDLPMTSGATSYRFADNTGWYISGTQTTDAQMAALKVGGVTGIYAGSAFGTYFADYPGAGAVGLSGTFQANVNFAGYPSPQITNFNLTVSGGGNTVSVSNAIGVFAGNTSQFAVAGGTVSITGGTSPQHIAAGSFYGPNAEAMGGVWGVSGGSANATGIFHGTR